MLKFILLLGFILLSLVYPILWVVVILLFGLLLLIEFVRKKEKGYLDRVSGLYGGYLANIYLYPDKVTLNEVDIIPINNVIRAEVSENHRSIPAGYGMRLNKVRYVLIIHYTSVHGYDTTLMLHTKENPSVAGDVFEEFAKLVNKTIGYAPKTHQTGTRIL